MSNRLPNIRSNASLLAVAKAVHLKAFRCAEYWGERLRIKTELQNQGRWQDAREVQTSALHDEANDATILANHLYRLAGSDERIHCITTISAPGQPPKQPRCSTCSDDTSAPEGTICPECGREVKIESL